MLWLVWCVKAINWWQWHGCQLITAKHILFLDVVYGQWRIMIFVVKKKTSSYDDLIISYDINIGFLTKLSSIEVMNP